jgi:alcohol dehydrogenase (cytochrome c)
MKTRGIFVLLAMSVGAAAQVTDARMREANPNEWLTYNGSYSSQRYSLLKQVSAANVAGLVPKWIFHVPNSGRLESVPVVVDGVMYITQPNEVYALDARTGRKIWDYHWPSGRRSFPNRGVAVWGDKVYFGTSDAHLVALNARGGNLIWDAQMSDPQEGYASAAAPLAVNGKIITGIAAGDWGLNGVLDAYDAETGKRLWRFNAIPRPGEPGNETWAGDSWKYGGGDTWLTGSYDPDTNLIYWGIGNPAPDFNGDPRKGDNLYTECMIALDADTGKLKWYFQYTPHDNMDWDSVEIPVLVDAPYKGKTRKLLAQANRNGFYYVLDRTDGKFLTGVPFVKLMNWATALTEDGRPVRIEGREPTPQGSKVCPATSGATNWMSPAYSPDTGYFYVVAQEGCGIESKATEAFRPGGFPYRGGGYIESPEEPWRMHVRALDLATGKVQWDFEQVGTQHYGAGLLSTAGGLLFAGDDRGNFTAHDARTGKPLWHFYTGQPISASPMTYSLRERQYVALAAGSDVIAFGLFE